MNTKTLLEVKNLSVTLDRHRVIDKVSFAIAPCEVIAIIGPNGAGKSVLLKTLLGILPPSSGTIRWKPNIRVGYLPQRFTIDRYIPLTVKDFFDLKPTPLHYTPEEALRLVTLPASFLNKNLAYLSGGELQRILLAWAIIDNPQLLLFDEPTENVDPIHQESIYNLLNRFQNELHIAAVIVSHDLHVVYKYARRVICLNKQQVCYGPPQETLTNETLGNVYGDHAFFHHHHYNKQA